MKTQLLEDFGESGSAPADPGRNRAGEQSPGAVPQAERPPARSAEPAPLKQPLSADAAESGDGADLLAELMAIEAELQTTPALATTPEPADTSPEPEPEPEPELRSMAAPALELPNTPALEPEPEPEPERRLEPTLAGDFPGPSALRAELNSQPAREVAHESPAQWSNVLKRRALAWGTAAILLASLAGGGLWLHRESKVEEASAVLATTKPVPPASASRSPASAAPAASAGAQPDPSSERQTDPVGASGQFTGGAAAEVPTLPTARIGAVDSGGGKTPAPAEHLSDSNRENLPQPRASTPKHRPAKIPPRVRKQARAESNADTLPDSEFLSRERLEETLMQCRAHGYGREECLDRSCEMTRFGFSCRE